MTCARRRFVCLGDVLKTKGDADKRKRELKMFSLKAKEEMTDKVTVDNFIFLFVCEANTINK